jgi:hypothetical protein
VHSSAHDLALFGMLHVKAHRTHGRPVLSDASVDMMQRELVDADGGMQYGLGWWVEDRFGYRTLLAQGGTDASSAYVRVVPSERIVAVVIVNKGVGFPQDVADAAIGALLPRYAASMAAQGAQLASASASPRAPTHIDSAFVGTWTGFVRAEKDDMRMVLTIGDTGQVQAAIEGEDAPRLGRARMSTPNFRVDVDGNLESQDSTAGRRLNFYLTKRGDALNGTVTTQPPAAGGLIGRVSYWVSFRRRGGA